MWAQTDLKYVKRPSVLERRERIAVRSFVRGQRWFASKQLEFQKFPNRRFAGQALIQSSRRLIERSRQVILKAENLLAFSRKPRKFLT